MPLYTTKQVQTLVLVHSKINDLKEEIDTIISSNKDFPILDSVNHSLDLAERSISRPMASYADQKIVGKWAINQMGIGPVFAAGLLSHIDVQKSRTVGDLWRYAGLDPSDKTSKTNINSDLKSLCWKIGTNFAKYSSKSDCFYGHLYLQDRTRRLDNNENGLYSAKASSILQNLDSRYESDRHILSQGKLSVNQIEAQARRFAVKIFLSHYYAVAYHEIFDSPADRPTTISINGTKQEIQIPDYPFS